MATFQISPPEQFNFSQPDELPKWIRRFERFRDASGLSKKDEVHQVNTLLHGRRRGGHFVLVRFVRR